MPRSRTRLEDGAPKSKARRRLGWRGGAGRDAPTLNGGGRSVKGSKSVAEDATDGAGVEVSMFGLRRGRRRWKGATATLFSSVAVGWLWLWLWLTSDLSSSSSSFRLNFGLNMLLFPSPLSPLSLSRICPRLTLMWSCSSGLLSLDVSRVVVEVSLEWPGMAVAVATWLTGWASANAVTSIRVSLSLA